MKLVPPSVLISHWTLTGGVPVAEAENITSVPAVTDFDCGSVTIAGLVWLVGPTSQAAMRSALPEVPAILGS